MCCPDGKHCCPEGHFCGLEGKCIKANSEPVAFTEVQVSFSVEPVDDVPL